MEKADTGQVTPKDNLKKFEDILDEYVNVIGTNRLSQTSEMTDLLGLTNAQLETMSAEECGIAAYQVGLFSSFLQREINRHKVRVDWANDKIDKMVARVGDQYGDAYTKYEYRRQKVIMGDNKVAYALDQIATYANARVTELSDLPFKVSKVENTLIELQRTKRYEHRTS